MLNQSTTAILSRGESWRPGFVTEPFEAGWASEGVLFLRALDDSVQVDKNECFAHLQISPDGIHWVNEGSKIIVPDRKNQVTFVKISHFGQFIRFSVDSSAHWEARAIMATLSLK